MEIYSLAKRAFNALNLEQYNKSNAPDLLDKIDLNIPDERQFILRMSIRNHFGEILIPEKFLWTKPLIDYAISKQSYFGINHSFCYLTIRSGVISSNNDIAWHVDGFSTKITHIPEQNYIWTNSNSTEYVVKQFNFPKEFNPLVHNVHYFFQDNINEKDEIFQVEQKRVFAFDPYVVHRRPIKSQNTNRTMVRVSFVPIQIIDDNNTQNPLIPLPSYNVSGLNFRDKLKRFENV